jgi:hypothetical protein
MTGEQINQEVDLNEKNGLVVSDRMIVDYSAFGRFLLRLVIRPRYESNNYFIRRHVRNQGKPRDYS